MDVKSYVNDVNESNLPSTSMDGPPPRKKAKSLVGSDPTQRDLASLPINILLTIFSYLDQKSISNCAVLCSTLNNISKHGSLYKKVTLKYNMNSHLLESLVNKISCPRNVNIEYKWCSQQTESDDNSEFNKYVGILLRKCGEYITTLSIDSCKIDEVLVNISECTNLKSLELYRCKGSFKTLPSLNTLLKIKLISCHFPQKIVSEFVKNNENLKLLFLSDNVNVNVNEICENMPTQNTKLKIVHLSERKKLKAKSVRSLAKLTMLKKLELISGSCGFECDPEDSLEQLAAGCTKLEFLAIYGWKEVNDDNFIPALHKFTQLKELDLRGINITVKSCREAAITLPLLKTMDVIKCRRVKKAQLAQLQKHFREIRIPLE